MSCDVGQDSIGGSCHSVMITNVAPEESFYYDTYCTLNLATKSRKIVNNNVASVSFDRPAGDSGADPERSLPGGHHSCQPSRISRVSPGF